jgi:hypothetical protein
MPRAGFYAIQASTIRFGRDGNWYADDERISNPRIADLFSRHVVRDPAGGYMIRMGDERAPIVVDDTPYVVRSVSRAPAGPLVIALNDGTSEPLDLASLAAAADSVLYCQVKEGTEPARFLRAAYYQLEPYIRSPGPAQFVIDVDGATFPIRSR